MQEKTILLMNRKSKGGRVISPPFLNAGIGKTSGKILYTASFYTSQEVMKHIFTTFGMLLVGTYELTKKKSRIFADFPFHTVSCQTVL